MGPHDGTAWREYSEQKRMDALDNIRWHWGGAYEMWFAAGMFWASRRDTGAMVKAETAEELHDEVVRDYETKPVPREYSPVSLGPE